MPSLPPQRIHYRTDDDQEFIEKVTAGVTVDGIFTLGVPDKLLEIAKVLSGQGSVGNPDHIKLTYQYRQPARIQCSCMAHGINFLKACAADYMKAEEKVERVIVYRLDGYAAAWMSVHGLSPNGQLASVEEGAWWEPKTKTAHAGMEFRYSDEQTFHLGFGARVMDRKSIKRATGESKVWKQIDDDDTNDAIKRLNGFIGLRIDPKQEHFEVMPYTPDAANFFSEIMLAIAQLVINIDAFFADTKRLQLAIKNAGADSPFLLTAPTTTKPVKPAGRRN